MQQPIQSIFSMLARIQSQIGSKEKDKRRKLQKIFFSLCWWKNLSLLNECNPANLKLTIQLEFHWIFLGGILLKRPTLSKTNCTSIHLWWNLDICKITKFCFWPNVTDISERAPSCVATEQNIANAWGRGLGRGENLSHTENSPGQNLPSSWIDIFYVKRTWFLWPLNSGDKRRCTSGQINAIQSIESFM